MGALLGAYTAVLGVFLLPVAPVPFLPVGLVLVLPANFFLARAFRGPGGGTAGAAMPGVAWLAVTLVLGLGRPEGDLALLADWPSFGLVVLGAAAASLGIAGVPSGAGSRETGQRR